MARGSGGRAPRIDVPGPRAARSRTGRTPVVLTAASAVVVLLAGCAVTVAGLPQRQTSRATAAAPTTTAPVPATVGAGDPGAIGSVGPSSPPMPAGSSHPRPTRMSGPVFPTMSPASSVPDSAVGLRAGAPVADIPVTGATHGQSDTIAIDTLADLFDYYGGLFQKDFGRDFVPPAHLVSYDSTDPSAAVCGRSTYQNANAFYDPACDAVAWDRGVLLPELIKDVGVLAPAVVLSHEIGHDVQYELGVPDSAPTIVLEQQADCYAGAYWRWVADGHSKYFDFNQTEGMRQLLLALFQGHDPVGSTGQGDQDHGNGFDRTYAATLGYTSGAVRCSQIDAAEIAQRGQEFPFNGIPQHYGNVAITQDGLAGIVGTVDGYFTQVAPGYAAPTLITFDGATPPPCQGFTPSYPVTYCPATNTVAYNLAELQRIGTPTAGWQSANGDFSAIVLLVSRYALAAQAAGHSAVTGNNAGLRALCYAGSWATWMRNPQGPQQFQLSPNDLDKAIYQIVASPLAGSDANGRSTVPLIERVQAFDIGVTHPIPECFDFYSG